MSALEVVLVYALNYDSFRRILNSFFEDIDWTPNGPLIKGKLLHYIAFPNQVMGLARGTKFMVLDGAQDRTDLEEMKKLVLSKAFTNTTLGQLINE